MVGKWQGFVWIGAACFALAVAGCGGGGGGGGGDGTSPPPATTLSGVAAAGAPIIGTVFVKDALGVERHTAVEASDNGHYSVDVSGLTAPFKLKVVGTVANMSVTYCSVATGADVGNTVNITPFTDLIVANLAAEVATNFYTNGDPAQITSSAIATKVQDLADKLAPVLQAVGVIGAVDLLHDSFVPGDKLDKVMDVVKVSVDPATAAVEIKNILDNSTVTGTAGGTLEGTLGAPTADNLSDLDKIRKGINDFAALFATSLPTVAAAEAFFDPAFLDDGRNRAAFVDDMMSHPIIGFTVTGIAFVPEETDLANGKAAVFFVVSAPSNPKVETVHWNFRRDVAVTDSPWKPLGNRRLLQSEVFASAYHAQDTTDNNPSRYGTGISLSLRDDYNLSGVAYAVVTGPGLPNGTARLYNQIANVNSPAGSQFTLDPTGANQNDVVWLGEGTNDPTADSAIGAAFPAGHDTNVSYTIELYDAGDNLLATYTELLRKRPYKTSELAAAPFAALTAPSTVAEMTALPLGQAVTLQWTLAAGTSSDWVNVQVSGTVNNQTQFVQMERDLEPTQKSATGTIDAPAGFQPNGGSIWLSVSDADGRVLSTSIQAWRP